MDGLLSRPVPLLGLIALLSFGSVGLALVSQYHFDMQPCPWCTLQRLIFLLIGAFAVLGLVLRSSGIRRVIAAGGLMLAVCGIASALWQHFVAAKSDSCNLTLADRIMQALGLYDRAPEVFAPMASCAEASITLLGIPYAFWSLFAFLLCALGCVQVMRVTRI
ncbi:MAG TPA: disulfide bond formation protein B [Ideonella sp.]|uniref:disulfide bond formation protein B n=1 Tax=Ideonella sp. TaxID=1929293 RepID=UPI002E311E91|nr:disulfide bond formation protein B [Ideonella sp.]HEX5685228.1 disulfide bond formation protein B [Ideonella sp.]